jgi:spermidine synthase
MTAPARGALYAAFALSGGAALVYESIWSRYLGLLLGHSAFAQVLVLTVFLGGMAVGAALTGWRTTSLRSLLFWYAGVEVAVGLLGFVFHDVFGVVSGLLYDSVFPRIGDSPVILTAVKSATAALLILPQSILLGATFPLMSAAVLRWMPQRSGGVLGWLYASNSLGAAIGVLVAGFYLTARFGFPGTLTVAAILNVVAGLVAVVVHVYMRRRAQAADERADERADESADEAADERAETTAKLRAMLLLVAFGTAVASFAYEIAWIRMLSLVLGSATHAFELMLSAFILGLGLGALWVALRGDRIQNPIRALVIVQCVMGAMAAATLPLYVASFGWMADLLAIFARTAEGYAGFTIARYGICLVIMLPATICAGMTLPLVTKILYRAGARESAIGEVYGSNTAGSIVGVQLAALVFLPILGVKMLLVGAALIDIALGAVVLPLAGIHRRQARWLAAAPVAALLLVIVGAWASPFDQRVMHSGVFRIGRLQNATDWVMMFHRDGRTATVTVRRSKDGLVTLATNGKPDASLSGSWFRADTADTTRRMLLRDDETQLLLPIVALAHRPRAQSVAVIGHGSGITSHVLLGAPHVRRVTTIEIEPEMVNASMVFFPFNRRVFEDSRSHMVLDDARAFFAGAAEPFDLIVSEPSNPWVSGVSGLFTTEFYAHVRRRLAPDGVFTQWLNLYEMNDALVRTVLASIQSVFPVYDIYMVGESDIAVVATTASSVPSPDWTIVDSSGLRQDLTRVVTLTPSILGSLFVASSSLLSPYVGPAVPNSDYAPLLDLEAERARFMAISAQGLRTLNTASFDFASALQNRPLPLPQRLQPAVDVQRVHLRATSARIRAGVPRDSVIRDTSMYAALQRRYSHDFLVASGERPSNWQLWTQRLALIDRDIHAGSPGSLDTALFAPLDAYLRRTNAPPVVRTVVRFLRAMDGWDFGTGSAAADELVVRQVRGESWIPADYLRDAAVTAKLMTGDPRGALVVYYAMQRYVRADAVGTFRSQLLMAQIGRALTSGRRRG